MNPADLNRTHFISKSFDYSEDKTPLPLVTLRSLSKMNYESLEWTGKYGSRISSISDSLADVVSVNWRMVVYIG